MDGIAGLAGCCRAEDAYEVDFSCEVFVQDLLDIDFFGRRQLGHRWYRGERFLCHSGAMFKCKYMRKSITFAFLKRKLLDYAESKEQCRDKEQEGFV